MFRNQTALMALLCLADDESVRAGIGSFARGSLFVLEQNEEAGKENYP
jgi:hypothetical protein